MFFRIKPLIFSDQVISNLYSTVLSIMVLLMLSNFLINGRQNCWGEVRNFLKHVTGIDQ